MNQLHPIETTLAAAWPPEAWSDVTVLLAVSGGADSVALCRAMACLKTEGPGRLHVAHFNHGLRGDESEADEKFVRQLCDTLALECHVGATADGQTISAGGDGLEAAAREARYEFLTQTAQHVGARYVVTAHTADDQAETILHRILRGTGIGGLSGMARARRLGPATTLIRPLLEVRRADLVGYLGDLGQLFRSDSSNDDTRLTRNRIRRELLPQLARQYNTGVLDALLRLGTLAGQVQSVVDELVDELVRQHVEADEPDRVRIDIRSLTEHPEYLVRELLISVWRDRNWPMQAMGFAQWDQLAEMISDGLESDPPMLSKRTFPGGVSAEVVEDRLQLTLGNR